MQTTANYGLKKPEGTDAVNIQDFNENADVIDQKLKEAIDAAAVIGSHAATHQSGGSDPIPTAAPSGGLGTANAVGSSTSLARADHTHLAFDSTNPVVNGTATPGSATTAARRDHIHPTDSTRAPLASPTLTGTPTAPTAALDTSTTQLATTAFVLNQAGSTTPLVDGVAAVGVSKRYARTDHVHPTDTSRAAQVDLDAHLAENATLTAKGHVQLSSATNSTSEVLAATPKAVKAAMDQANAAFQSANDGKTGIANAVTAKGVSASPSDTFTTLASKIGQIETDAQVDFANYYSSVVGINKVSNPTPLSLSRYNLAGASTGNYALFAGGSGEGDSQAVVDAYNQSLVRTTPTVLSQARENPAGASIGNYALFAGGISSIYYYHDTVDAYNTSLVRSTPTPLSKARINLSGVSNGDYALFAGGQADQSSQAVVDAYSTSLVRSTPTALSVARYSPIVANVGNYALFAGGINGDASVVDAYNQSLVRTIATRLSQGKKNAGGASNGSHALFAGGDSSTISNAVDAYNQSLTLIIAPTLSQARYNLAGASSDGYAMFAGGRRDNYSSYSKAVDIYDASLVRSTPPELSLSREIPSLSCASVGDYNLFAGWSNLNVEAYLNSFVTKIPVTVGSKYKFIEGSEQVANASTILSYDGKVTGYVKYKKGIISR